ncbi:hypothetical protein PHYBLDRAFT_162211 [Phycomyces blakesleeanus NRRL 1555(-)]|uniref:Uncharacterized protein n=1 Tax=Phycomyces blakesleeanus (strain ATCC 8743b / DSM 1359 / FGSC 10004 / NBRC 33097 / NRRL 1555) TaxID=763407 RepID=A0A163EKN1_PHYB8|nr:hypothetical protein PHYBLDRAFT_162211 [Phycomyces blakesleeanus NRRL 1555(-)]OAD79130.1 hypothetical protein PHYBLDRAFT_162211 [Phycomyces blakesleeanus NRRL 1555(-)]|eukprot:XP_018297170.1 hypothetical protein PHYBLDRAFT_162211 [Phycomyces blakesleeanus NRRL 1555(-)]
MTDQSRQRWSMQREASPEVEDDDPMMEDDDEDENNEFESTAPFNYVPNSSANETDHKGYYADFGNQGPNIYQDSSLAWNDLSTKLDPLNFTMSKGLNKDFFHDFGDDFDDEEDLS